MSVVVWTANNSKILVYFCFNRVLCFDLSLSQIYGNLNNSQVETKKKLFDFAIFVVLFILNYLSSNITEKTFPLSCGGHTSLSAFCLSYQTRQFLILGMKYG